jgi:hypothetical protein
LATPRSSNPDPQIDDFSKPSLNGRKARGFANLQIPGQKGSITPRLKSDASKYQRDLDKSLRSGSPSKKCEHVSAKKHGPDEL